MKFALDKRLDYFLITPSLYYNSRCYEGILLGDLLWSETHPAIMRLTWTAILAGVVLLCGSSGKCTLRSDIHIDVHNPQHDGVFIHGE